MVPDKPVAIAEGIDGEDGAVVEEGKVEATHVEPIDVTSRIPAQGRPAGTDSAAEGLSGSAGGDLIQNSTTDVPEDDRCPLSVTMN